MKILQINVFSFRNIETLFKNEIFIRNQILNKIKSSKQPIKTHSIYKIYQQNPKIKKHKTQNQITIHFYIL